jgi:hypothetical protein
MKTLTAYSKTVAVATALGIASILPMAGTHTAMAQDNPTLTNVVPESAAITIHAKIQAIDPSTGQVTLTGRSGTSVTTVAGPNVRLELLKVGDTVNAKYYRSVAFLISQPGTTAPEDQMTQMIAQPVQAPGGIGVRMTRVSGLVVGIDLAAHSVDTITAVISQALAASIEPAPKSWF